MVLYLTREYHRDHVSGILTDRDKFHLYTLERPDLNNEAMISCIPEGTYSCKIIHSPHFGYTYEVQNVPMRTHILIHPANWVHDLKGCIGVGKEYIPEGPMITHSRQAWHELKEFTKEQPFQLMILGA